MTFPGATPWCQFNNQTTLVHTWVRMPNSYNSLPIKHGHRFYFFFSENSSERDWTDNTPTTIYNPKLHLYHQYMKKYTSSVWSCFLSHPSDRIRYMKKRLQCQKAGYDNHHPISFIHCRPLFKRVSESSNCCCSNQHTHYKIIPTSRRRSMLLLIFSGSSFDMKWC